MTERLLSGKSAVVTGGTRGIGRAIVEGLLAEGAAVIATGTAAEARLPEGCRYHPLQLEDEESVEALCAVIGREAPHILVNNAGASHPDPIEAVRMPDMLRLHQINLFGATRLCQAAIPGMKRHGWGRIVNLTSGSGSYGLKGRGNYGATKAALNAMTASLAVETAPHNILANCVAPGFIETDVLRRLHSRQELDALAAKMPMGRLGKPEEVAALVVWLASPRNGYVTAQNIFVDGGFWRTRL